MSACPIHDDDPLTCPVCEARCEASPSGRRCTIVHDEAKHAPAPAESPTLTLSRAYPYDDGRYGA